MYTIFYAIEEGDFFYAPGIPFLLMKIEERVLELGNADLGPFGITINAICVDPSHTEMRGDFFTIEDSTPCRVVPIVMSSVKIIEPSLN